LQLDRPIENLKGDLKVRVWDYYFYNGKQTNLD
jgi:hypothetical protein